MEAPYIPRKTLDELASPHMEGSRHAAIIKIAMSLLGNRLPPDAVFSTIRQQFDAEKTDKEIWDVIDWCQTKNPSPSVPLNGSGNHHAPPTIHRPTGRPAQREEPGKTKDEIQSEAVKLAKDFVDGDVFDADSTSARSLVDVSDFAKHTESLLSALYSAEDRINVVCQYTVNEKGKANPQGSGKSLSRDEWLGWIAKNGVPISKAGAWVRPNPCGSGTGADGAIKDDDILRLDFMLVESDFLPLDLQLSLYAKWKLPIAAILTSGGDSAHAWVKISAPDREAYRTTVARVLEAIKPFGFDQSNKNPSRLSRLPGAVRTIGASGKGEQRLLYLNPNTDPFTEDALKEFEKQVLPPFPSRHPLKTTLKSALDRYDELQKNKGKTGLRTGLATFDKKSGGLKPGLVVLAAETNAGKTACALNIINTALNDGNTCALFTLEMDRDEIFDLLLCMNLSLDRNIFNTGDFSEGDIQKITTGGGRISRLPLHIFDDSTMTCDDIDNACAKLSESHKLKLVVVDYLQLVQPPLFFKDNREQQIAHIGRALRTLARKYKVPVIAVSQLNEEGKIRESRAVAHDANIVFLLQWEGEELKLKITKGRSVMKATYPMFFDSRKCKMAEASKVNEIDYGGQQ